MGSGVEGEGDCPLAPPPLPAHAPSAALVAMEEGADGHAEEGAETQQTTPEHEQEEEKEWPWTRLRLVTPEAAAELELVARALDEGQRRVEALGVWVLQERMISSVHACTPTYVHIKTAARLAATAATRRAVLAPTTAAAVHDEQETAVVQLLPPRDPALLLLLERARELAARAVAEIFRGLRLEGAVEEEVGCCWLGMCMEGDCGGDLMVVVYAPPPQESSVVALDITAIAEADEDEEGEGETEEAEAAGPPPQQQQPVHQMGMGAVRAAMVEGLYEAMRERLACQAEEVSRCVEMGIGGGG